MIYYENHIDIFILAKVMEMKEKEREIFSFEILYAIHKIIKKYSLFACFLYNSII